MKVFVYHYPCADGFSAYYAALLRYGNAAEYLPETPGYPATKALLARPDIAELDITYYDCCPTRELLEQLNALAKQVEVRDHHLTAERTCGDLPYVHIDKTQSGAVLAWKHLFPKTSVPVLFQLVQDRDLWEWKLPDSRVYNIWLDTLTYTYTNWHQAHAFLENNAVRERILNKYQPVYDYQQKIINHHIVTNKNIRNLKLGNHTLAAINSSVFKSEVGKALCELAPAAAVYHRTQQGWNFSLRSTSQGPDVESLARLHGGGGHRNASGFRIDNLDKLVFEDT